MIGIDQALQTLGLTPNETAVYTYLLRSGVKDGAVVYRECRLDKSSAYRALSQLVQKGLVYSIGETRNQQFGAYPIESLRELHRRRLDELIRAGDQITQLSLDLDKYVKESYGTSKIFLTSGAEGYIQWIEARLEGRVDLIREFVPLDYPYGGIPEYDRSIPGYIERRVGKGIHIRTLINGGEARHVLDQTRADILKEARRLPAHIDMPAALSTFGERVGFVTEEKGGFLGIIISDPLLTRMVNGIFDYLWQGAIEEVLKDEG